MSEPENSLAVAIRRAFKRSGMTAYRLSKLSGVSESALSRFLSGKMDIRLGVAAKLCKALGLTLQGKRNG